MINVALVSAATINQLEQDGELNAAYPALRIERSEYVNEDPNRTPWIGVFRSSKAYRPRTMGRHARSWDGEVEVMILVQYASLKSGASAEDELEDLLSYVENALVKDTTIGGTLEILNSLGVRYSYRSGDEPHNVYFQQATLTLTGVAASGVKQ